MAAVAWSWALAAPPEKGSIPHSLGHRRMVDTAESRLRLSPEQARAVCREFVPIGDRVFDYMGQLREAGFRAFLPRHHFVEVFAETPEQLAIHRRCVSERVKEWLAKPWPMTLAVGGPKSAYVSPYLQQLREERDRVNGVGVDQLGVRFPEQFVWREEVDPCKRRVLQARGSDFYEARWSETLDEERRVRESEAERLASGLGKVPHTFDKKGRYAFFVAVMERDAGPLGFQYDRKKSRAGFPVFSKSMTDDWHLCWALEESRGFSSIPMEGSFEPFLELRSRDMRGAIHRAEPGEFLHIRHSFVVPGFSRGYWRFFSLGELEVAIKAHLHLYSLMAPIIEDGIARILRSWEGDRS